MKVRSVLQIVVGLASLYQVSASSQIPVFSVLHTFSGTDGNYPVGGVIVSGTNLYGTTYSGGQFSDGTIYALNTDGSGFTNLHNFSGSDGASPWAGVILSAGMLYGTTLAGGNGTGTVFQVGASGAGFATLHPFSPLTFPAGDNSDGGFPEGNLLLLGDTLYGTSSACGEFNYGTIFSLNTNGGDFQLLHTFTGDENDGGDSYAGLISAGGYFYGTASMNDLYSGSVFVLNSDNLGYTNLCVLPETEGYLVSGMTLAGNTLFGTSYDTGGGMVFGVNTDSTGFSVLHTFAGGTNDGASPNAGLVLSEDGNTLYGITGTNGAFDGGTIFAINADGSGFTNFFDLPSFVAGVEPGMALSGNTLYGTSTQGSPAYGMVFSLSIVPQLTITASGTNILLAWPTGFVGFSFAGYGLQSTSDLTQPMSWAPVLTVPAIANGQYTVTAAVAESQQFFRLAEE